MVAATGKGCTQVQGGIKSTDLLHQVPAYGQTASAADAHRPRDQRCPPAMQRPGPASAGRRIVVFPRENPPFPSNSRCAAVSRARGSTRPVDAPTQYRPATAPRPPLTIFGLGHTVIVEKDHDVVGRRTQGSIAREIKSRDRLGDDSHGWEFREGRCDGRWGAIIDHEDFGRSRCCSSRERTVRRREARWPPVQIATVAWTTSVAAAGSPGSLLASLTKLTAIEVARPAHRCSAWTAQRQPPIK